MSLSASVAKIVKDNILFSLIDLLPIVLSIGALLTIGIGDVQLVTLNVKQLDEHSKVPPVYPLVIHV